MPIYLAWKLALVIGGHADPKLLDTYEEERLAVPGVCRNIPTAFKLVVSDSWIARPPPRRCPAVLGSAMAADDEGKFPGQVIGILQARIHSLRAHRAVDVGRVAKQEAAAGAEPFRSAVMDAIGREPAALFECQIIPASRRIGRHHFIECQLSRCRRLSGGCRSRANGPCRASGRTE